MSTTTTGKVYEILWLYIFYFWFHYNFYNLWCHLQDSCPIGVFNQLVSLSLCTCSLGWCRLILNHTPKLRVLRFEQRQAKFYQLLDPLKRCCSSSVDVQTQWEQPSSVPKCLISSLETVEWIDYKGREVEKKVVMYLLENSRQLKTMAIRSLKSTNDNEKLKMLQELSSIHRICTKCGLSFTWSFHRSYLRGIEIVVFIVGASLVLNYVALITLYKL